MDIRAERRFSVNEAARLSGMSAAWWKNKIFKREVRFLKVGGRNFIPESTLKEVVHVVEPMVQP